MISVSLTADVSMRRASHANRDWIIPKHILTTAAIAPLKVLFRRLWLVR
jgi:hypothetical protein